MAAVLFQIIAMLVVGASVIVGYRRGLRRQVPALIAVAFGAVASHIFVVPVAGWIASSFFTSLQGKPQESFVATTLAAALVFGGVYSLFYHITRFMAKVFGRGQGGVLNGIIGAFFLLFKWSLWLSLAYNILLCWQTDSVLMTSLKSDDGNAVEEVMRVAPAVLGSDSPDELRHRIQLHEAKSIS